MYLARNGQNWEIEATRDTIFRINESRFLKRRLFYPSFRCFSPKFLLLSITGLKKMLLNKIRRHKL
jgi:hypothetical protein